MLLNGRVVFLPAGGAFQFQNIRGLRHHHESLAQAFLAILGRLWLLTEANGNWETA
jgi:hypothetical protein